MVVELVWEARDSMGKCLEMGKSEERWKLASNSICQEPREHARWLRFFPEPCGAAALSVHPQSSTLSSAPQASSLIRNEDSRSRNPFLRLAGGWKMRLQRIPRAQLDRAPRSTRVCCKWMHAPWGCARPCAIVNLGSRGQISAGLEAQSLCTHSQALLKVVSDVSVFHLYSEQKQQW